MTHTTSMINEEYKKCADACEYFLSRYAFIRHPSHGKVLFDLYNYQIDTIWQFEEYDYNIVLKGRQMGLTTLAAGYALWRMLFHGNENVVAILPGYKMSVELIDKVRYMHSNLPHWLQGNVIENNKLSMRFSNDSQISIAERLVGTEVSLFIFDEASYIDNCAEIWEDNLPTLSRGGKVVIISSASSADTFFHKMWQAATTAWTNEFNPILLDWRVHPERGQAWRDRQTELLGVARAAQEHDVVFAPPVK